MEAQLVRREWMDPSRAQVKVSEYAARWISERPGLRPRTVHLYTWLLGKHVTPYLGGVPLARLDTPMIRQWRTNLLGAGVSQTMAAKAYRLLRAILTTAVKEDEILRVNPCRIPGADQEKPGERSVLTVGQVLTLAEKVPPRYKALVLVTTFACLRWGEVTALQRQDIELVTGTVQIRQAFVEQRGVGLTLGPPKSKAGFRTVTIPAAVLPSIRQHLEEFVGPEATAFVFTGPNGRPIWRGNFNKLVGWPGAVESVGMPGLHFHDLRHTGNTLAAKTGASLRDLMARMGHDNPRAALIYQHASAESDRRIADAVSGHVDAEMANRQPAADADGDQDEDDDGAAGVMARRR